MTKNFSTKRALLASIVVLCLCVSMLVGTTFAWFTDSVTSSGNVIQSGILDIEMFWTEGTEDPANANWKDAKDGAIFNSTLWEPGRAEAKHLRIDNVGKLALANNLAINPHGEVSELADVIDVYYASSATQLNDRDELIRDDELINDGFELLGTLREFINQEGEIANELIAKGTLAAKSSWSGTIVLKMRDEAGNYYQNMSIGTDFSIQLMATQTTAEKDSFGDDYDQNAYFVVNEIEGENGLRNAKFVNRGFLALFHHVDVQMVVGHLNVVVRKCGAQIFVQSIVHIPVHVDVCPADDLVFNGTVLVVVQEHSGGGILQNVGGHVQSLIAGGLHGFGGGIIGGGDQNDCAAAAQLAVVGDLRVCQSLVGHHDDLAVGSQQSGIVQGDILHGADHAGNLNGVTDVEGMGSQNHHAAGQIGQNVFCGQGNTQRGNGQQSHQRGGGNTQTVDDDQGGQHIQNSLDAGQNILLNTGLQFGLGQNTGEDFLNDTDDQQAEDQRNSGRGNIAEGQVAQIGVHQFSDICGHK